MKTFLSASIVALLLLYNDNNLVAAQYDTGMIELKQPDEITFTGRIWGDEFFWWAETEDGYRFIQSGDGWYYFATLNQDGEFAPTTYKVGTDTPPPSSYQLERTQARIDEIKQMIEEFIEQVELNRQWFAQKQEEAQGQPVTLKVGLILIEFQDVKHFEDEEYRPDGYLTADFDSMMFSNNYWYDITAPTPHPENELIFGSFRDYWHQMSLGKLIIEGRVANPTDESTGVPKWLTADYNRQYYLDYPNGVGFTILANEAIEKAIAEGYISITPGDTNYYDNYGVVYAKYPLAGHAIGTRPEWNFYLLGEQIGTEVFGQNKSFTHIGLNLNSFGVNIGFWDGDYGPNNPSNTTLTLNFDLMSTGWANGPLRKGECAGTLAPYFRINKKWIEPTTIINDTSNFLVEYDYDDPNIYRINPIDAPGNMHYLFEVRKREGFDLYVPEPPETYQNQSGTLLIWQDSVEFWFNDHLVVDKQRLKQADYTIESQLNDFFPSSGNNNNQSLNDTTLPAASLGNLLDEHYANYIEPAHFAINGIHKLGNGNTLIDEIKLNHAIIRNKISSGWKTVSVGAILSNYSASSVFPTAISSVYGYVPGQGYVVRTTLANGPGYWVNFGTAQTLVHAGLILDSLNIPVKSGWNLIGSISDKVPKLNICTEPPGLIVSMYFYDGGYNYLTNSDSLKPGRGYWINAESDGNVILLRNFECPENEEFNLGGMDKFIITDANGKTQDLYVANVDIDTTIADVDRSLPPPLPVIDFDARFNYGEFIKAVSVDSGEVDLEIDVQTNDYPITLSWEINPANGIEYSFISDSGLGKISSLNKKLIFDENSNGKIKLFGKVGNSSGNNLPENFQLYQNYPNPFNPLTTIKYDIVKAQDVKVIVYDILGREIAILVNEQHQPGSYQIKWDASNVSSGIYFYQLKTKDYVDTKKMILLK